jgi:hypothetical protein
MQERWPEIEDVHGLEAQQELDDTQHREQGCGGSGWPADMGVPVATGNRAMIPVRQIGGTSQRANADPPNETKLIHPGYSNLHFEFRRRAVQYQMDTNAVKRWTEVDVVTYAVTNIVHCIYIGSGRNGHNRLLATCRAIGIDTTNKISR